MFKWLICLFKGHDWNEWFFIAPIKDSVRFQKCGRCGKCKGDGDVKLGNWLMEHTR